MGGEDAVVDDEVDGGIGVEGCKGGSFVGVGGGIEDRDAEGCVAGDDVES